MKLKSGKEEQKKLTREVCCEKGIESKKYNQVEEMPKDLNSLKEQRQ